jgi:DNA-binding NtrC family response regulator
LLPSIIEKDNYDIYLLDMNFTAGVNTGNEGIYWMRKILEYDPTAIVVLITAYSDVELAVKAMKEGATDFIQKSWDEKKILSTVLTAYKLRESKLEIKNLKNKQTHLNEKIDKTYPEFIGNSPAMQKIITTINKVAKTDANVLILGENGTGKELVARELHRKSKRTNEVFVSVDMAALSGSLFESEMFGHKKGAFTDANEDRAGRFEIASGGSLFLDEIGNLPMSIQAKLLTVLQNREITRIGTNNSIPIDIRLISATNKDIYTMVDSGTFREDLLYRLNTIQIELPPLRDRIEDIPILAKFFLKSYEKKYNKSNLKFSQLAISKLTKYQWHGNVRELKHTVEKAVILCNGDVIKPDDFFIHSKLKSKTKDIESFSIVENEKDLIRKALQKFKGNLKETAKQLGISRSTLYLKIEKYEL